MPIFYFSFSYYNAYVELQSPTPIIQLPTINSTPNHQLNSQPSTQLPTINSTPNHQLNSQPSTELPTISKFRTRLTPPSSQLGASRGCRCRSAALLRPTDAARSYVIRAEPSRAEPGRAEPSRAESSRVERGRAEPSRAGPAEPSRVEPAMVAADAVGGRSSQGLGCWAGVKSHLRSPQV